MKNGCIFLISARKNLLKRCLGYLDANYNNKFNYPILIFYHGSLYDDKNFRKSICDINPKTEIQWHGIGAEIPEHLGEEDMFWNLPNNNYAKKFKKTRLGYLHANHFWHNFMNYPQLGEFDYMMRIDDDSWFKAEIAFDMFEKLDQNKKLCGTAYSWSNVNHRGLETRFRLYGWIKELVEKYNILPKNKNLRESLDEGETERVKNIKYNKKFHSLKMLSGNCNIYNKKMFDTEEWRTYLKEFNELGGGYRYRWGDCEVISLFYYLYIGESFLDLNLKEKKLYHNQIDHKWDCIRK